ncbi:hypothetical protein [Undibacterium sp. WLX3042]|uniref:hypothetical protein n=1 Tax=Undibacterium sp. WLX3042 TaxID=3412686 RepID=UPI003C2C9DAB
MPKRISKGEADSSQFTYGPEHQRSKQTKTSQPNGNPAVTTTYYAGAQEADINNGQATVKTYWPYGLGVEIDQAVNRIRPRQFHEGLRWPLPSPKPVFKNGWY